MMKNNGQFQKGSIPWNKGKKGYMGANRTSFKKGNLPHNYCPIGSIRFKSDYYYIKLDDPNKWELYHRYMYRKYHNVEPDVVIFLDGDIENFSKENLFNISRAELVRINKLKVKDITDKELRKASTLTAILEVRARKKGIKDE